MYKIYPEPKRLCPKPGTLLPVSGFHVQAEHDLITQCRTAGYDFQADVDALCCTHASSRYLFSAASDTQMHPEAYELCIDVSGIALRTGSAAGLYYAMQTLKQLASQCNHAFPFLEISDSPSLDIRGVILDIGRNKIPSMETMFKLLELFASMRLNHVEFYMEGYCYAYRNYPYLFTDDTPVTAQEFQALDTYAKSRFIDLVPNQNVLGHMDQWLATPQINPLAECEDGFIFENLFWRPPMTLDVKDSKSLAFITDMLDDLLENFTSSYVNVNMDEPFELGKGKNKEEAQKSGTSGLYLDYVNKINRYCKEKGKRMMMWGDQILENPHCVASLPKDILLLDWIYEGDAHFEAHAQLMQKTGLDYCLCPGTSSWGAITGRSDNMKKNIKDAAACAVRWGGKGILTTDWGDLGHWQYLSCSYPAFSLTGLYSWSGCEASEETAAWFCNRYLYMDASCQAYQTAYALGNYYHYEHAPLYNTTLSFAVMSSKYTFSSLEEFDSKMDRLLTLSANIARTNHIPPKEPVIHMDYEGLQNYLTEIEKRISSLQLQCSDGNLILKEMKNGIRMIRHGALLYHALTEHRSQPDLLQADLTSLYRQLSHLLEIHYTLWKARNRMGGFSKSISHMLHLLRFYQKQLKELQNPEG